MLIVRPDLRLVEAELLAGAIPCPRCRGPLRPWGHARLRVVRSEHAPAALRPRRARCPSCRRTQVLLPDLVLSRRVDVVAVIGSALTAAARGLGHRRVAEQLGRPPTTVRGWLRRFRDRAGEVAVFFRAWAHHLDPMLDTPVGGGPAVLEALEAIGLAARAASLRLGPRPPWSWVSVLSLGALLANTSSPWLAP